MSLSLLTRMGAALVLVCATLAVDVRTTSSAAETVDDVAAGASAPADDSEQSDEPESHDWGSRFDGHFHGSRWRRNGHGSDLFSIGHDSKLTEGQRADSVVSILGSSTNEGDAGDVVSILGNTRVSGPVRDSAVAVMGSAYIDGKVDGDVVAVMGNVDLGPKAEVGGQIVSVLGSVRRDPAAIVHGGVKSIFDGDFGDAGWLRTWIKHCLLYARPLALVPGLGWAWGLALGFLAFYACLAVLFRDGIDRCVRTFETQPGQTLLAAIIAMLLVPVLVVLLCVTLVGIAAVPFVVVALACVALFGKAVMLAWVGGRIIRRSGAGPFGHPAFAVLVGGAIVLVCYLVPVLGFLIYKLLGILGFGAVIYTLILATRAHQAAKDASFNRGGAAATAAASPNGSTAAAAMAAESVASPTAPPSATPAPLHVAASMPRAGFWIRMAALLLDVLLIGFATSMLHHLFHMHLIVLAVYGAMMWKLRGATVGGLVFDLKVVRADGREMDWETAIIRAMGCFLSLAVAGLGFIWIAFDSGNQAWHDKIAGTVVVRVPKTTPA